jgi:hypothetical protein
VGIPKIDAEDIVAALRAAVSKPCRTGAHVVYILTQVRKLLELTTTRYDALNFHCNWVLHTKLNRGKAKQIVLIFDSLYERYVASSSTSPRPPNEARELFTLNTFRAELCSLMKAHKIRPRLFRDDDNWFIFASLYVDIIEKIPLEGSLALPHVKSIVVTKENHVHPLSFLFPVPAWGIIWQIEVNKVPEGHVPFLGYLYMFPYGRFTNGRFRRVKLENPKAFLSPKSVAAYMDDRDELEECGFKVEGKMLAQFGSCVKKLPKGRRSTNPRARNKPLKRP